jgi:hypothetical protein
MCPRTSTLCPFSKGMLEAFVSYPRRWIREMSELNIIEREVFKWYVKKRKL